MERLRVTKAMELRIGETGPNIIIPIMYGAIDRYLEKKVETDIDKAVAAVCRQQKIADKDLAGLLEKYNSLPHQVKRYWSGEGYKELMAVRTYSEAAKLFKQKEDELRTLVEYTRHRGITALPHKTGFVGLQPIIPRLVGLGQKCCCCCCCCCKAAPTQPSVPETPSQPPPEQPPKNRYSWEFGPSLKCLDAYEDWYGDDLYAVYAWGDGAGESKLDMIPKTDGTNDLDAGETGTWPYPKRLIYPAKAPKGYLHIEIDIWERDYTAEFFSGLLSILGVIAGPIGTLIAGAAGGAIGSLVGKALEAARSQISDNADDNYLGKLVFDYPQGETDLHTFVGSRSADWTGNDCRYVFDYNIRELAP